MVSKYLITGLAVAGGSAGSVGIYALNNKSDNNLGKKEKKPSFESRINKKERVILDSTHTKVWNQLLAEYKDKSKATNLIKGIGQDNLGEGDLKIWCSNMRKSEDGSELEFNSYVSWCTRENLITKLKEKSKAWNNSANDDGWSSAKSAYDSNDATDVLIPANSDGSTTITKGQATAEQIRNYCKGASSIPFIKEDDPDYKRSDKWCTNK